MHSGKWRIKPSGRLPIFLRFMINSSFTRENAHKAGIKTVLANRTYLHHMMYWPASEYNAFEDEIINHMKTDDGWFENYCQQELKKSEHLYQKGLELKKTDWSKKSNQEIVEIIGPLLQEYRELACPWYAQYSLDEYFEDIIEKKLLNYLKADDKNFRRYVLIFTDPKEMTEVAEERWKLTQIAKDIFDHNEDLDNLSGETISRLNDHLDKFAYINRGLATSKPYSFADIIERVKEMKQQVADGKVIDDLIYEASAGKIESEYRRALEQVKPKPDLQRVIDLARLHSYLRNRRVEAFFNADYGASFAYAEVAKRANFNQDWIMEISVPEMINFLKQGAALPDEAEMNIRFHDYAMIVRGAETRLITDLKEIKELENEYSVEVAETEEIHGRMACLGGIIKGRAKVCLDKEEIYKVERGDILVAQYTTPDFVPAMEKAAAIVADQGGLSSHAAIVSRELGVPCVIATKNGTRVIKDNDLLEIDAQKGIVKIIKRA
ncbi:MAG: Phosphoenolpyruvate synthase/pyruvate phosphate dikinase [Parcubacteria group bacterium GW2011_GWF2_45_11]|nr:MAG: Phosphoenolpyruvate synthase/pyruvate phosphate dikinase [Parcubacteria group bacterium GW2011_GWF2_45_11]